jgi:hypothetical protein
MSLRIAAAQGRALRRGDFNAAVRDGDVLLPAPLARTLTENRIVTGERLAELAFDLPGVLASILGWSNDEVLRARRGLSSALRGHVDPEILEPTEPFERGFGALPPPRRR